MLPEIILASSSEVRQEVLRKLRVVYSVQQSEFKEKEVLEERESFEDFAKRLALGKAREVAHKVKNAIVVGVDSFAVVKGEIMGKPHTQEKAVEFLKRLSGDTHEFYTGMAVIDTQTQKEIVDCVKTKVSFRNLTTEEISQYIEREEVTTAAGAYRIQSLGAILIDKLEGDYYAVVGFSPSKLQEMLRSLNYNLFDYVSPLGSK